MNVKNFLTLYAVLVTIYGIFFLFFPNNAIGLYGGESSALLGNAMQGLGSVFIPAGIMSWIARDASASFGRKAVLSFIGLSSLIFGVRSIISMVSDSAGMVGSQPYIDLAVQIIFAAGGLYFFSKEKGFMTD
ncbi:MAG: hypothetical protein ACI9FN_004076 [Saprospiraceae bacterium]|jgi:hypothetical protein